MPKESVRQLAAIMFTDMIGYTALMQDNEKVAKGNRDRHRRVLNQAVGNHAGQTIQYYGDGTLSIFNSAIEAVKCAVKIQTEMQKEPTIPLRIGIHTGDIVYDDEGIYGDGVNIASRIESLSVSGSVMISDKVFDEIKNHKELITRTMGEFELKNVRKPIEVFAVANDGLTIPSRVEMRGKVKEKIKSIAVMPFINMSTDPENEYFSDGITEELINALTQVDGLQVISRTSSFSFKGKNLDVRDIGKQLNVHSVLEGSVRKSGNKVRISAQLVNTADGYHVWSNSYNRDLEDIFELQDEIARKIANNLRKKLTEKESNTPIVTASTDNMEAYNHYLKGLYYSNKWTPGDAKNAIKYFQKAIEEEPEFSLSYSGMASSYTLLGTTGNMSANEASVRVKKLTKKALELNPVNADAYLAEAVSKFFYDWDWEGGLKTLKKAKRINPNVPSVRIMHTLYYLVKCDFKKAEHEMLEALKVDPLSTQTNRTLADTYYFAGDYDQAIEVYDRILTLDPTFKAAQEFKGWAYLQKGDFDRAITIFENLGKETTHAIKPDTQLGYAHALAGNKKEALKYLEALKKRAEKEETVSLSLDFATLYAGLEDLDNAFLYLEKCLREKFGALVFLTSSPIWKPLKKDPRFLDLIKKVGLEN